MLIQNYLFIYLHTNSFKPEIKEGINALSLRSDGFEVLTILLARTHAKMVNAWACERIVPVHTSGDTLDKHFLDMQEHLCMQQGCGRTHHQIEQSRLFLTSIKDSRLISLTTSMLSELRGLKLDDDVPPHLKMMLLPGAITNHHLHRPTSLPYSTLTTIKSFSMSASHLQYLLEDTV